VQTRQLCLRLWTRAAGESRFRQKTSKYVSVGGEGKSGDVTIKSGKPGNGETFQLVDLQRGDTLFLSLATHRYIIAPENPGAVAADHSGPAPYREDGPCFTWRAAGRWPSAAR